MPTPPLYRFFAMKDDITYYQYVDGVVIQTADKIPVKSSPDKWDGTQINYERHKDYHGFFSSLAIEYQFVEDLRKILQYLYYTQGVEAVCYLYIEILNNYDYTYTYFHRGAINFRTSNDQDTYFNAALKQDGALDTISANGKSTYQISCNSSDELRVTLDGISLFGTYHFVPENTNGSATPGQSKNNPVYGTMPYIHTSDDGDFPVAISGSQFSFVYLNVKVSSLDVIGAVWPQSYFDADSYLLNTKQDMDVSVSINGVYGIQPFISGNGQYVKLDMFVVDNSRTLIQIIPIATSPSVPVGFPGGTVFNFPVLTTTSEYNIPSGCRLFYIARIYNENSSDQLIIYSNEELAEFDPLYYLDIKVKFKLSSTETAAIKYCDVYDRLMKKVFNTTSSVSYSAFLRQTTAVEDNVPYYTYLTPGDAIRMFDVANIKTSLNDLLQDAQTRWCLGLGVDNSGRVVLEHISKFYDKDTLIAGLGEVTDFELTAAEDYMFNEVNVGQDDQQYDSLNGRDEYNQKTNFRLPITSVKNAVDWVSPYRYDMYGIETYRANLSQKETTDSDSDNDTFILSAAPSGLFADKLRRPDNTGIVTGVLDPASAYNIDLSAAHTMRRNFPLLAMACHLRNGKDIEFGSTSKNAELASKFNSSRPLIVEKDPIPVNSLGQPVFLPIKVAFTSEISLNIGNLLKTNPYGYFLINTVRGTFKVFMTKASIVPSRNSVCHWEGLLCPDNDLSQLYA